MLTTCAAACPRCQRGVAHGGQRGSCGRVPRAYASRAHPGLPRACTRGLLLAGCVFSLHVGRLRRSSPCSYTTSSQTRILRNMCQPCKVRVPRCDPHIHKRPSSRATPPLDSIAAAVQSVAGLADNCARSVAIRVAAQCVQAADGCKTVPRLYLHTGRPVRTCALS